MQGHQAFSSLFLLSFFVIGSSFFCWGQTEEKNWYFGTQPYGLSITEGGIEVTQGKGSMVGGASAIATHPATGEIIFYTGGHRVYDANNNLMPDGNLWNPLFLPAFDFLTEEESFSQFVAISPDPRNCDDYFIFTNFKNRYNSFISELRYYRVNMSAGGQVQTSDPYGELLALNTSEGMITTRSDRKGQYWLVYYLENNNLFQVISIDDAGINATPAIYNLSSSITIANLNIYYVDKENAKIAVAPKTMGTDITILNIDLTTGNLSLDRTIAGTGFNDSPDHNIYDTAWSPDGTKLYYSRFGTPVGNNGGIYQVDLATNISTRVSPQVASSYSIKKAPNGRIYHLYSSIYDDNVVVELGCIENPNASSADIIYRANPLELREYNNAPVTWNGRNFPEFMPIDNLPPVARDTAIFNTCFPSPNPTITINPIEHDYDPNGDIFRLEPDITAQVGTVVSNADGTSTNYTPPPTNSCFAADTITYTICEYPKEAHCFFRCDTGQVFICLQPTDFAITTSPDALICPGQQTQLSVTGGSNYIWSNPETLDDPTSSAPIASPLNTTIYTVTVTQGNDCPIYKVGNVIVNVASPDLNAPNINWQTNGEPCVEAGQFVNINVLPDGAISDDYQVTIITDPADYFTQSLTVIETSQQIRYGAPLANACTSIDEFRYELCDITCSVCDEGIIRICLETEAFPLDVGEDVSICRGESSTLNASGASNYLWDNGSSDATIVVNPSQTTTYSVTATDAAGCSNTATVTVNVVDPPIVSLTTGTSTCNATESGASTTINLESLILDGVGGDWEADINNPSTVSLSDPTALNFDGFVAGNYTFTYTLSGIAPCTDASESTIITVSDCSCPNVTTIPTNETLCNDTGSFDLTQLQDANIEAGTWQIENEGDFINPAQLQADGQTFDASGADAGSYTLTYTLTNPFGGDCPESSSQNLVVYAIPTPTNERTSICLEESTTLTVTGGTSYLWDTGATTASINVSPNADQTYLVTVTSAGNCSTVSSHEVTVIPPPDASLSSGTNVCNSTASGESTIIDFTLFIEGDTNGTWQENASSNSGVNLSDPTNVDFANTPPATYTFEYTVSGTSPCTNTSETIDVLVINCDCPIVSTLAPPSNGICTNTSFNLADLMPDNLEAGTWSITNTANFSNPATILADGLTFDATNADAGTYELTYFLTSPVIGICPTSSTQTIQVNALPTASISNVPSICLGETSQLVASGGATYLWDNGATSSSIMVNPINNTTYAVTITSDLGCSSTTSTTVTVLGEQVTATDDLLTDCVASGETVTLPSPLLNDLGANPDSLTINLLSIQLGQATINPNTQAINYTALADNACISSDTLTYQVCHITCNSFCDIAQIVVCLDTEGFAIETSADQTICPDETVNLSVSGGIRYEWQPASSLDDPNSAAPTASPAQTTTYTVTAYDDFDCSSTGSVTITVNEERPVAIADEKNTNCVDIGMTTALNITANDQFTAFPFIEIINTQLGTALINSNNNLEYTAPNQNACSLYDTIQYRICNPNCPSLCDTTFVSICLETTGIPANAGEDVSICQGGTTTLNASGGIRYEWSPNTGLDDPNIATPTASPTNTTTYTVTVYDADNCSGVAEVTVNIDDNSPQLNTINTPQCLSINEMATLNVLNQCSNCDDTSDLTVRLLPSNLIGTAQITDFDLSYTAPNNNPCSISDTIHYQICRVSCSDFCDTAQWVLCLNSEGLSLNIAASTIICQGDSVQLTASGADFYTWQASSDISDPTISNPFVSPSISTTYVVEGNDGNGCTGSSSIEIVVDVDEVRVSDEVTLFIGESTTLSASSGFASYNWTPSIGLDNPSSANPVATPDSTITYLLTATNENACSYQDSVRIIVNDNCDPVRVLPTAFSPNNDGMNDQLLPLSTNLGNYELRIYNRWGNLVFESNDPLVGWDGLYQGEIQPIGVYVFSIRYTCKGDQQVQKGHLTLMR